MKLLLRDKEVIVFGLFVCLSILVSAFIIPEAWALDLSNITLDQQTAVCGILNFTFSECYVLWEEIEGYNYTCEACNYSNYTITSDCFNKSDCDNCSEDLDELTKIDKYATRGYEPIFKDGKIVDWKPKRNESCEAFDCTEQCNEAVQKYQMSIIPSQNPDDDSESSNMPYYIILGLIISGILAGIVLKKLNLGKRAKIEKPLEYAEESPEPPKPKDYKLPLSDNKLLENVKVPAVDEGEDQDGKF